MSEDPTQQRLEPSHVANQLGIAAGFANASTNMPVNTALHAEHNASMAHHAHVAAGETPHGIAPASLAGMYDEEVPITINEDAASCTKRTVCGAGSAERLQEGFRHCG